MSLRCGLFKPTKSVPPGLVLGFVLLLMAVGPVLAQDTTGTLVSISSLTNVELGVHALLDITLESVDTARQFGGFDLMIAWDPFGMSLTSVVPGALLDTCGWEYFTYRADSADCSGWHYSTGVVRIVAVADVNNGPNYPSCHGEFPGQLAQLDFLTTSSNNYLGVLDPVRFLWCDCGDNAFSSVAGDTLWISDQVWDFGYEISNPYEDFPTYFGARVECPADSLNIYRGINYKNGSIEFREGDSLDIGHGVMLEVDNSETIFMYDTMSVAIQLQQTWPTQELGGFDFLIQHQLHKLRFLSATPGSLLDECGWEYFTYVSGSSTTCGGAPCPEYVVRVVALADLNNGDFHPSCYADSTGTLATLQYEVLEDSAAVWSDFVHIEWVWYDCGDNSLSNRNGDTLFVSDEVFDVYGAPITADGPFPTEFGAPDECIVDTGSGVIPAQRCFDFFSTGTMVAYVLDIDERGDVNLNGVSYEIADWVIFTNYFLYGLEVFTVNLEGQIAATDVNADGIALSLADLVYLYRVIIGDALPIAKSGPATLGHVVLTQDGLAGTISVACDDSLSALYLVFDGEIEPTITLPDHTAGYYYDGSYTRLLIYPDLNAPIPLPLIPNGVTVSYTGEAALISAEAAYDGVMIMTTEIQGSGSCCQIRGNIDSDGLGEINIADLIYLVAFMFQDGPEPACISEADINGDGSDPNIADLIHLVGFMFQEGPAPAVCP